MLLVLYIFSTLLTIVGAVWILQGINILPGSFMTGQIQWAVYGAITSAVGIGLFIIAKRSRASGARKTDRSPE